MKNSDGSFTVTTKNGTISRFELVPGTPFLIGGPVYRLVSITDRNDNLTQLSYVAGQLASVVDPYGRALTFVYTPQGKLKSVGDPLGRVTTFAYDATGTRLTRITDAAGRSIQYTYNSLSQITRKVDKDGRVFTVQYLNGRPIGVRDGAGTPYYTLANPLNWATDPAAVSLGLIREYLPSTTSKTDGRGQVWQYEYDVAGYVTRAVAPDGATTTYTYDPATLRVASVTDPNGHTIQYVYDAQGNRVQTTDALGHTTTYTYETLFNQVTSMTDPQGRVTTWEYDARGNRIKETDPLGQIRRWTYDSHGNVLTAQDKRGNVTTLLYDSAGNRIQVTDALGNITTMTYDVVGNLLSRTDANGHTMRFVYDALNRVIQEEDALGRITRYAYDGQGNRVQMIDRNGNTTTYQYDLRRRLTRTIDALGKTTTRRYDANDNLIALTDKNAHTTTFFYDTRNRRIRVRDALANVSAASYDAAGNLIAETDANGHTTTSVYDPGNRRVQTTDPVGNVMRYQYDTLGPCAGCSGPTLGSRLVTKRIDGNGKVIYYKYDGLDRMIREVRKQTDTADIEDGDDAVTVTTYDANGNRVTLTEPDGHTTSSVYDALDRRVQETNGAGDVTKTAYDGVGNPIATTAPNGNVTTMTYDAVDRRVQTTDSAGPLQTKSYDGEGNHLTVGDGNGNVTTYTYDAVYRVATITDPLGQTTVYTYDAVGNQLTTTDRAGQFTTSVYDSVNRLTRTTDALGNVTAYRYDAVGNRIRATDANNHATLYAYDGMNRLVRETYADGRIRTYTYDVVGNRVTRTDPNAQTTTYTYSDLYFLVRRSYPVGPTDTMTYDLSGRLLSADRGGWLVTYAYDGADRVVSASQQGRTVGYAYDVPGRTRTIVYPGGRTIVERTDVRGRIGAIDDALPNLVQYAYDAGDRVVVRDARNGVRATYAYDANDRILALEHLRGVTRIAGFGYTYDVEDNKQIEQKRHDPARSEAYQYDGIYRLIDYRVGALVGSAVPLPLTQTQYTLDRMGNWNVKTTNHVPESRAHSVTNAITAIGGTAVVSDNNGNTVDNAIYRYAYDEENRLTAVTRKADGVVVGEYFYDALGRRVAKIAEPAAIAVTTVYLYDDRRIIEEQDVAGTTLATYVYGGYVDEVLTMDRGGTTFYYHQNALWSVAAITDALGTPVERYLYDAYGTPAVTHGGGVPVAPNAWGTAHSAIGNPWLFTGRELDEETGLYFYRARSYDGVKGRFLQRDPLGMWHDPLHRGNGYLYAADSPVNYTDWNGQITGGDTACNPKTGVPEITNNNNECSRPCTQEHEEVHKQDYADCCKKVSEAIKAAGTTKDKNAEIKKYNDWFNSQNDWAECRGYTKSVECVDRMLKDKKCDECPTEEPAGSKADKDAWRKLRKCCDQLASYKEHTGKLKKKHCDKQNGTRADCPW